MANANATCPVCAVSVDSFEVLADHLVAEAGRSEDAHVMWLNRNVTKHRMPAAELAVLLRQWADGCDTGADRVRR